MNNEITMSIDGKNYTAVYAVDGETLFVTLPDGTVRRSELRGLQPASAARPHLISWVGQQKSQN